MDIQRGSNTRHREDRLLEHLTVLHHIVLPVSGFGLFKLKNEKPKQSHFHYSEDLYYEAPILVPQTPSKYLRRPVLMFYTRGNTGLERVKRDSWGSGSVAVSIRGFCSCGFNQMRMENTPGKKICLSVAHGQSLCVIAPTRVLCGSRLYNIGIVFGIMSHSGLVWHPRGCVYKYCVFLNFNS